MGRILRTINAITKEHFVNVNVAISKAITTRSKTMTLKTEIVIQIQERDPYHTTIVNSRGI